MKNLIHFLYIFKQAQFYIKFINRKFNIIIKLINNVNFSLNNRKS